jgi:hypothetical protein
MKVSPLFLFPHFLKFICHPDPPPAERDLITGRMSMNHSRRISQLEIMNVICCVMKSCKFQTCNNYTFQTYNNYTFQTCNNYTFQTCNNYTFQTCNNYTFQTCNNFSAISHPPSAFRHPSSVICPPSSVVGRPSFLGSQ